MQTYNLFPKFFTMTLRKQTKIEKLNKQITTLNIVGTIKPLCNNYEDDFLDDHSYLDRLEKEYYSTINQMNILDWPDMD